MTQYSLWCDAADGTQHFPCPAQPDFDHLPTADEQIAFIQRTNEGPYRPPWQPDHCHFDFDPNLTTAQRDELITTVRRYAGYVLTNEDQFPDGHWSNQIVARLYALSSTDAANALKKLYRCTHHGTKPKVFRRRSAYTDRWHPVLRRVFDQQMVRPEAPGRTYRPAYGIWVRRRPPPNTFRSLWA